MKRGLGFSQKKLWTIALWLIGSLLAIALIADYPYLGLAVAVVSGIAVGLTSLRASLESSEMETGPRREGDKRGDDRA